jgi:hypothetical protein
MTYLLTYAKAHVLSGILLMLLFSCASKLNKNAEILQKFYGQKIYLPQNEQEDLRFSKSLKIITKINGDCPPCINQVTYWDSLYWKQNIKIPLLIYLVSKDSVAMQKVNYINNNHSNITLLYDKDNDFIKTNKLFIDSKFHTMLLDEQDEVLILGSPIKNDMMEKLYINELNKIRIYE